MYDKIVRKNNDFSMNDECPKITENLKKMGENSQKII